MPDRSGRIGYDDWIGVASSLRAITGAMDSSQNRAHNDEKHQHYLDDRDEGKTLKNDVENNLYAMDAGPQPTAHGDGEVYDAPGAMQPVKLAGSAMSQAQAREIHTKDKQNKEVLQTIENKEAVLEKENQLWKQYNSLSAEQRDAFLDNYMPQSRADFDAFTRFGTALETNSQFKDARIQRNVRKGAERFKQWSVNLQAGSQFLQQGNTQLAEKYIEAAINDAHHPLFIQKNKNGTYDLIYEESGTKKLMGDDITLQQAYQKAMSIPARDFVADYVMQKEMITKKNREAGFQTWKKGKDSYDVTVVYKPSSPNAGVALVYKKGGGLATNEDGSPMTLDDLKNQGFRPEKLDDEYKKQQIETSKASMRSHDRANQAGDQKKVAAQNKMLSEQIKEASKFFGTDNAPLFDENGEMTEAGSNARTLALEFYEAHKANPEALEGAEYRKFHVAKALVGAVDKKFGVTPKPISAGTKPPVEGARKAKDGFWYVQRDDSGWSKVHQGNDLTPEQTAAMVPEIHGDRGSTEAPSAVMSQSSTDEPKKGNTKWEDTPLGKFEAAVLNAPDFLKKSEGANKEAYQAMQGNRTHGTSIPGVNTFKRQY